MARQQLAAESEVVDIAAELIRIDTRNTGARSVGERVDAEYFGGEPRRSRDPDFESEPSRASVVRALNRFLAMC